MGKHFRTLAGTVLALCLLASSALAVDVSFSHTSTEASPWNQGVMAAIKHMDEASGGEFKGTSYPNGVLFQSNWEILLEMTQTNSIQVGIEAMSALASLQDKTNFLCLPFLFKDNDHVMRFMNSGCKTWDGMIKSFEDSNIVILGIAPRPMRQLSNNLHPVESFDDLQDLTLRSSPNLTLIATLEALGIKAVPMPSGEIYSSIQLGTVNGEDNSLAQQYDAKTYEVIDYFTLWNYVADGQVMFMSKDFYDAQTPENRKIFREMGRIFAETTYAADDAYFLVAKAAMEKKGVKISEMPEAEKKKCAAACVSVYDDFKTKFTDAEWKDLMDAVENTRN